LVAWVAFLASFVTSASAPVPFDFIGTAADCFVSGVAPFFAAFFFGAVTFAVFGTGAATFVVFDFLASDGLLAPEAGRLVLATAFATSVAELTATPKPCPSDITDPVVTLVAPDFVFVAFVASGSGGAFVFVLGLVLVTVVPLPLILAVAFVTPFVVVAAVPLPLDSVGPADDFFAPTLFDFVVFGIVAFAFGADAFDVAFFGFFSTVIVLAAGEDSTYTVNGSMMNVYDLNYGM
jgi:hypothetical protein